MARNEEKQQGRLNRLWLQKEREEGRLKEALERRPKLSTLNSASSVKKWIPSIKNEIEYYLQQSQLTHYPERKIAEFQLHIDTLEKEYKRFIAKLRVLDPSCKHKPWTPRAYSKRRADTLEPTSIAKVPRPSESQNTKTALGGGESDFSCKWTGCHNTTDTLEPLSLSNTAVQRPVPISHVSGPSGAMYTDQDQPLSFDNTRLAVATAAFRGPLAQRGSSQMQNLAAVLQSSLPNLSDSSLKQTFSAQSKDRDAKVEAEERIPGKPSSTAVTEERTGHILGLDCYSSSDEECDS